MSLYTRASLAGNNSWSGYVQGNEELLASGGFQVTLTTTQESACLL